MDVATAFHRFVLASERQNLHASTSSIMFDFDECLHALYFNPIAQIILDSNRHVIMMNRPAEMVQPSALLRLKREGHLIILHQAARYNSSAVCGQNTGQSDSPQNKAAFYHRFESSCRKNRRVRLGTTHHSSDQLLLSSSDADAS